MVKRTSTLLMGINACKVCAFSSHYHLGAYDEKWQLKRKSKIQGSKPYGKQNKQWWDTKEAEAKAGASTGGFKLLLIRTEATQGELDAAERTGFLGMTHELEKHLPPLLQNVLFWHCHNMSLWNQNGIEKSYANMGMWLTLLGLVTMM